MEQDAAKAPHGKLHLMDDLIFVSMENWDAIWRRNQFLCSGLAEQNPDAKVLFVGLARDVSHDLRHGRVSALRAPATAAIEGRANITFLRPLKLFPNTLRWGRLANEALFRRQVVRAARTLGLRRPTLWLNPHSAVHMAGRMGEARVIYDITDDWSSLTQSPALLQLTKAQDAALCRQADAVIVCSERLYEMKKPMARQLFLVPNGVDAAHYGKVLDGAGPLPPGAQAWPHPVLGYTGTIHPDRVDVDMVEALAQAFPQGTIALIGPNFLPPAEQARLDACANVKMTGPVSYAELPNWMRAFDVCITPHRMTPFTESLNPIKLWEYLAAGKPIVSTDVAGFRDYPQWVRIARNAPGFIAAAQDALGEQRDTQDARRAEAAGQSWQARIADVQAIMNASGPQSAPNAQEALRA